MLYLLIAIFCLIAMITLAGVVIVKLCISDRAEKLRFLKNYKKGGVAIIYFIAIPIYYLGLRFDGNNIVGSLLNAVAASVELIVLKFDYALVASLMNYNAFYAVTIALCFLLATVNAVLFTLTLVGQHLYNRLKYLRCSRFSIKVHVVVGANESSRAIISSIDRNEKVMLIVDGDEDVKDFAFINKICYVKMQNDSLSETLIKIFNAFDDKTVNVIINSGDDAKNVIYAEQLSKIIEVMDLSKYSIDDSRGLNGYVFGEPENQSAFIYFQEKSCGCIHYVNKHRLVAMDLVNKYPITEFMTDKEIDYTQATVNPKLDVNVALLGFGKTNQQTFLTSVAINQLITKTAKGELVNKPINYLIYDKKDARSAKILNHSYFRFEKELDVNDGKKYLPIPRKPAEESFYELDINAFSFYESLRNNLVAKGGRASYNYVIIAFGSDMENLDLANKLIAKLKEWKLDKVTKVFVKVRNGALSKNVIEEEVGLKNGFIPFGNENEIVYNLAQIMGEKTTQIAKNKHLGYAIAQQVKNADEEQAKLFALLQWFKLGEVQRQSNVYASLSMRTKLHLLGYDAVDEKEESEDASEQFLKEYQENDAIVYKDDGAVVKGRREVLYTNAFKEGTLRYNYAFLEHERWNAYMISEGFLPQTIDEIKAGNIKDMTTRRHGNITTFKGLEHFRKLVATVTGKDEDEVDVIRYDYQIMDDAKWILSLNGQKIIKRK